MSLLFVAAEPREFRGLLARCRDVETCRLPVHWARTARLNGQPVTLVANGAGVARAAAAVEAVPAAEAIVSTGYCGALDPALGPGDILVANCVAGLDRRFPVARPQTAAPCSWGLVVSIDHIARTIAEKRKLRQTGAAGVDMEAVGAAERAACLGIPFYCVRAVTDLANESLRNDFNAALRRDGHFDTMHVLRAASINPVLVPELFRLAKRSSVAARRLGEFIADCRF